MAPELHETLYRNAGQRVRNAIEGIDARRRDFFHGFVDSPWTIEMRVKTRDSIESKLERKRRMRPDYTLDDMTDIVGVRAIVESPAMASHLARIMQQGFDRRDVEEFLATPRNDGYRGIHLVLAVHTEFVPHAIAVELQIRTILQHQWSVLSHSEFYKGVSEIPDSMLVRMRSLSEILNCAEIESEQLRRGRILDACGRQIRDLMKHAIDQLHGSPADGEAIGRATRSWRWTRCRVAMRAAVTSPWPAPLPRSSAMCTSSSSLATAARRRRRGRAVSPSRCRGRRPRPRLGEALCVVAVVAAGAMVSRRRRRPARQSQPVSRPSPSTAPSPAISLDDGVVTSGLSGASALAVGSSSPRSQPGSASSAGSASPGTAGASGGSGGGYATGRVIASCGETTNAAGTPGAPDSAASSPDSRVRCGAASAA
jgi:ppGpp synthetase/RelA/SpoT-type nucleotidyltranferase